MRTEQVKQVQDWQASWIRRSFSERRTQSFTMFMASELGQWTTFPERRTQSFTMFMASELGQEFILRETDTVLYNVHGKRAGSGGHSQRDGHSPLQCSWQASWVSGRHSQRDGHSPLQCPWKTIVRKFRAKKLIAFL